MPKELKIFVVGLAGTGKSNITALIAKTLVDAGIENVSVIDPDACNDFIDESIERFNGDYSRFKDLIVDIEVKQANRVDERD